MQNVRAIAEHRRRGFASKETTCIDLSDMRGEHGLASVENTVNTKMSSNAIFLRLFPAEDVRKNLGFVRL